jgi:mannitol/fructose-specific phosphotransferase system IIA component (Ntr-type)
VALAVILERFIVFYRHFETPENVISQIFEKIQKGQYAEAIEYLREKTNSRNKQFSQPESNTLAIH